MGTNALLGGVNASTTIVTNGNALNRVAATRAPRIVATERRDAAVAININHEIKQPQIQPSVRAMSNPDSAKNSGADTWTHVPKNNPVPTTPAVTNAPRPRRQYDHACGSHSGFSGQVSSNCASYDRGSFDIGANDNPQVGHTSASPAW